MSKSTGVKLFSNNSSNLHSESGAIDVAAGTETSFALSKFYTSSLIEPYSSCQVDSNTPLAGEVLRFKENLLIYRQTDCLDVCYQEKLYSNCRCIDIHVGYSMHAFVIKPFFQGSLPNFCQQTDEGSECLENFLETDYLTECSNKCPLECETAEFTYTVSFADVSFSFLTNLGRDSYSNDLS